MSLLITWPDSDPTTPARETSDPAEISSALGGIGCQFQRRELRSDLAAGADPDAVLSAYRDVVDELVAAEGFVFVDVAGLRPTHRPGWSDTAREIRAKFIHEHTHGDDDEVRFMVRGSGVFYLHIGAWVHAIYSRAGDLLGVPQGTTHWFDTGPVPDFTAIRFFHDPNGWVSVLTGSDISGRFPDFEAVRARARSLDAV